jgi:hypothetical protein
MPDEPDVSYHSQENSAITDQTATRFNTGQRRHRMHALEQQETRKLLRTMNLRVVHVDLYEIVLEDTDHGRLFTVSGACDHGTVWLEIHPRKAVPA